jgi:hypothetical protein
MPQRYGSPREGSSLAAATEARAAPVRQAVLTLAEGLSSAGLQLCFAKAFGTPKSSLPTGDPLLIRASWNLVSMFLMARVSAECSSKCSFREAEEWFHREQAPDGESLSRRVVAGHLQRAEQLLDTVRVDHEFSALLPYILEEHGPGSRASVRKDPKTASARTAKREKGVFYTPADVANYMVSHAKTIYSGDFITAKVLDPACGTGVFLLAMLRAATNTQHSPHPSFIFDYITSCLHGMDISGQALDAAAFVLLSKCLPGILARDVSPCAAWKLIRRNLVEIDALCIGRNKMDGRRTAFEFFGEHSPHLGELFPIADEGFDILIGNPPYAALGERYDFASLATRFASLTDAKNGPRLNLFPLFVEMMWHFTKPGCNAAALVAPLSLAFHSGAQFKNCRRAMSVNGGLWQFAFFDREPHALFGEEVKTRNTILFRCENTDAPPRGCSARVETGPLQKWTSRTRCQMFENINFTALGSVGFTAGIPKLRGKVQAEVFMSLQRRFERLPQITSRIRTCPPIDTLSAKEAPVVFVGATAYNFLNVYRSATLLPEEEGAFLSESPVHCLEFSTETAARAGFAILSSRIAFWLWHVLGDGFHVSSWLFDEIPYGRASFSEEQEQSLANLGNALWQKLQKHRFTSLNAGRMTVGYRPLECQQEHDRIDELLIFSAALPDAFLQELREFVRGNAVVDTIDDRRGRIRKQFI